ncbi:carboxypeptidase D-like [Diadema setosum]|uniref:carboxypeptidase D-like n=1 Tax=Diadema setosum TaxID=31175 RepID=UPI003B3B0607
MEKKNLPKLGVFILCLAHTSIVSCSALSLPEPWKSLPGLSGDEMSYVRSRFERASSSAATDIDTTYYHSYDDLTNLLGKYAVDYPDISRLSSIGQSVRGKELWVMQITDNPDIVESEEPWFKYVGNMHGNEVIGRQILIYLIEYLLQNYGKDKRVTRLVNNTNIFIMPTMNPDGFATATVGDCNGVYGRSNANNVDLNRNFPDQFHTRTGDKWKGRQPETELMMRWIEDNPFVLSANLHGGSLVASYPFDDSRPGRGRTQAKYSKSPDDTLFQELARTYANNHRTMHSTTGCPGYANEAFPGGITNGAAWYDVPGGMQDFNYLNSNCFEITVELSCCKYPLVAQLAPEWHNNREALIAYMEKVHIGVKGSVLDSFDGSAIVGATISVRGIDHDVKSVQYGNYWRLLLPGKYSITASADGYTSQTREVEVSEHGVVRKNFRLRPLTTFIEPSPIQHHSQETMVVFLQDLTARYPNISRIYSIGASVQDRQLMAIEISDNPGGHEPGEPEMKYVAGIHGNEVVGGEMLLLLAQFLCENYESSEQVRWLVDNTRIHIVPSMNPDGKAAAHEGDVDGTVGRSNHHNIDLNRNFPDRFGRSTGPIQPETQAIMSWTKKHPFVISAGLHGGSIVANYPYDGNKDQSTHYTPAPDDDTFQQLALAFSTAHGKMYSGFPCPLGYPDEKFPDGITNGADWYLVYGGMQDWNYVNTNTMEITVEMSCVKFPPSSQLPGYWDDNKMSLLSFIHEAHRGMKGFVFDGEGQGISHAQIMVEGIDHTVNTAKFGDYWRPLTPGIYTITVHAEGYTSQSQEVIISPGLPIEVNFTMVINAPSPSPGANVGGGDGGGTGVYDLDQPLLEWAAQFDFSIPQNFSGYLSNEDLARVLLEYQAAYHDLVDLNAIGTTAAGANIWAVEIGLSRGTESTVDTPRVALIGGLKGEEPVGRELLWRFIHHLGEGYKAGDERVTRLLNTTVLTIIPAVDYDGFTLAHEGDCLGDRYEGDLTPNSFGPDGSMLSPRPELQALKDLFAHHNFTLVLSIESNGMWVRYPYDNLFGSHGATTEDEVLFYEIANAYASGNPILSGGEECNGHTFEGGVVRGGEWKTMLNTLQDFLYIGQSEFMVTAHVSCCRYPDHGELERLWRSNLEALMSFTLKSHQGVVGKVQTVDGTLLTTAVVHHGHHSHFMVVDEAEARFRRPLPLGTHGLTASAPGYMPLTKNVEIHSDETTEVVFVLGEEPTFNYHYFQGMMEILENLTNTFPHLTHLESIGESVEGRPLLVLELGIKPGSHQPGRPEVKFIGSIHGNEPVGRELLLALADFLLINYGKDDSITKLMDTTHIHILPSLNPDGGEHVEIAEGTCYGDEGKYNAHGINLENDYPLNATNISGNSLQPESQAVAKWLASRPFTLGVNLYSGTIVARYPYNTKRIGISTTTADDTLFQQLAKKYAKKHPTMHSGRPDCPGNSVETYPDGIVNGATWKDQKDNLQDFTYDIFGCLDLAVHTGCCLFPLATELQTLWQAHRPALVEMIKEAHRGVQGFVYTSSGTPLEGATLSISGIERNHLRTSEQGDFWAILPDGQYSITASAEGHSSETLQAKVDGSVVVVLKFTLPEKNGILGIPTTLFLGILALSIAAVLLMVVCFTRSCRTKQQERRRRGFYRLDGERMLAEEFHDDLALKTFRNGDKKSLLRNMEFHDFTDSDSEDEATFKR